MLQGLVDFFFKNVYPNRITANVAEKKSFSWLPILSNNIQCYVMLHSKRIETFSLTNVTESFSDSELQDQLISLLKDNPGANFFCDETPIGECKGIPVDFLMSFAEEVKKDAFLWLACNHEWPDTTDLEAGRNYLLVLSQVCLVHKIKSQQHFDPDRTLDILRQL